MSSKIIHFYNIFCNSFFKAKLFLSDQTVEKINLNEKIQNI